MFVIYCGSFSQLLNYNIWFHEIQQSLLAPWGTLGPWTHSAYIVHFSTTFVPLSLHRRPYFPLQEPFISQSWTLPTIFFYLTQHSVSKYLCFHLSWHWSASFHTEHPTVLPQGFPGSPHLFGQALASDLVSLSLPKSKFVSIWMILSFVAHLCKLAKLTPLPSQGYRVLSSKVQLFTPQVICLGLNITPTHKAITFERKHLIQSLAILSTKEEILSFLEITYIPGPPLSPSLLTPYIRKPLAPHMKLFSFLSPFRSSIRISSRFQPFISQN